jgi:hypothetical protein
MGYLMDDVPALLAPRGRPADCGDNGAMALKATIHFDMGGRSLILCGDVTL